MTEELSDDDDFEYEDDFSNKGQVENKYETEESKFIQGEIQLVTRKIEREKIKLRIADERLEAKKNYIISFKVNPSKKPMKKKRMIMKKGYKIIVNTNQKLYQNQEVLIRLKNFA